MSGGARVVPITAARKGRAVGSRTDASPSRHRRPARPEEAALHERLADLEREIAASRTAQEHEGLLVTLARVLHAGARGLSWASLARLQRALYFAWHSEETDEFGADRRFTETFEPVLDFLYAVWWRVEATGTEHVPSEGPGLIVANHSGVLPYDGLMVQLAIRHEHPAKRVCRMLALDMFALLPALAPILSKSGSVRANPENAERLLGQRELLGVFPEGVKGVGKLFRDRYRLARFGRGGFVRIALRTGSPIIPCAVVGAEEIHPVIAKADWVGRPIGLPYFPLTPTFPWLGPLGVVPLPTKWSIDFGDPIDIEGRGPEDAEDPILVNRISEKVRSTIQRMVDGRLARRRSIWFG
ncbi:MAG TPA: lysophospholipid acyltransferase family protein [Vicinamibacteria bacterium]|nr:lysophospholipid acyltransferase family protein [Vicinamibacteria bacterium]